MLSRLQAINEMLVAVGEQVILVEVAGAGDYANASAILDSETRKVLAKGWYFNTDKGVVMTPAQDGTIVVPSNALSIDSQDSTRRITQREGFLYDLTNHTNLFTTPVTVNRIVLLPFEGLPFHVQREIVGRACTKYQRSYVGSAQLDQFALQEQAEAQGDARDAEVDEDDYNVLDNPDLAYLRRQTYRGYR